MPWNDGIASQIKKVSRHHRPLGARCHIAAGCNIATVEFLFKIWTKMVEFLFWLRCNNNTYSQNYILLFFHDCHKLLHIFQTKSTSGTVNMNMDDLIQATTNISLNSPTVISTESTEDLTECIEHIERFNLVALDCEGVDLGRTGQISIIQLSTPMRSFLFDVHEVAHDHEMVSFLRAVLENPNVIKIIHDCKMDADALFPLLEISLCGVHDTQCWDYILNRNEHNLNRTLLAYGCRPNVERDHRCCQRQ